MYFPVALVRFCIQVEPQVVCLKDLLRMQEIPTNTFYGGLSMP
jgi:hypothetical protein